MEFTRRAVHGGNALTAMKYFTRLLYVVNLVAIHSVDTAGVAVHEGFHRFILWPRRSISRI